MNGGSRLRNFLIVLGVLLMVLAWRYLRPALGLGGGGEAVVAARPAAGFDEDGGAPVRSLPAGGERRSARPGDRVEVLRMADLDRVPADSAPGRDPWRFVDPPPPPPPKPYVPSAEELRRMEEERRRAEEAARAAAAAAAAEAAKPKPPEFTMEYLGNFGPAQKRIAVFSNGKKIYNAVEGEVIESKFVVARIGYESVDIRFVGFPDWPAKRLGVRRQ
jgi:hypothetical protein